MTSRWSSCGICFEGLRSPLVPPLPPRGQHRYAAAVLAPQSAGAYCLRVTLVQEQVAWFDTPEPGVATDVLVTVI